MLAIIIVCDRYVYSGIQLCDCGNCAQTFGEKAYPLAR